MASSHGRHESRPHIFGANPLQFRQGTSVATTEVPPTWTPEMALDSHYPYTLREYIRDVSRWMVATKVSQARQGPLLALAVGGAARTVVEVIDDVHLINGAIFDSGDGQGAIQHSGPELLFHCLLQKFPENQEAVMLRTGLDFFAFTPRRDDGRCVPPIRHDVGSGEHSGQSRHHVSLPYVDAAFALATAA